MKSIDHLRKKLRPGEVYRRSQLVNWSTSVDRHVAELIKDGTLQKLYPGLFYFPRKTVFGQVPPDEKKLVSSFLKDDDFLLTSLNVYNSLGVGTTQLYNTRIVYNHKRHAKFRFGNQEFDFRVKHRFPTAATPEFLLVDLVNNLDTLAEDKAKVLDNVARKTSTMNKMTLKKSVTKYGTISTKKFFAPLL